MATYEGLSHEHRATLDLLIVKGQTYDQMADALGIPVARVRERALAALTELAPRSAAAVDADHRQELADYLLNQQSTAETASARSHLRRSESARAWSGSVLDSLEHLYKPGTLPTIPEGGTTREPSRPRREGPRTPLTPEAQAIVRRRRMIGAAAGAVLLLLIVLVWPIGLLTGDDGESSGNDKASGPQFIGQVQMRPIAKAGRDRGDAGIALVNKNKNGKFEMAIEARLPKSGDNDAYQVWLYNSKTDNRLLGAQVANAQGAFQGRAPLPDNYRDYRFIDISHEEINSDEGHSGQTVLRGPLSQLDAPAADEGATGTNP